MTLTDRLGDLLEVDRLLGDEDHVGAARDAAHDGDPACVSSHHLDDHDAVVRLGGRVQTVDRLGRDRDRRVEAERVIGSREVVVDRLRHADDRNGVLAVEPCRDAEGVLAADRDERVQSAVAEVPQHRLGAALELERIRPARPDDRPAARQDPGDLTRPEVAVVPLDEAAPALEDGDAVPSRGVGRADDRSDDGVETGAVPAAGQDPDSFRHGGISTPELPLDDAQHPPSAAQADGAILR